jgi:ribosomal protein S18 acetylase RimI-like enzyme
MQRYEIHLIADYHHFCLQDDDARYGDLSSAWTEEAIEKAIAPAPHAIGVGTARDAEVPVTVELHEARPDIDFDAWDRVNLASLRIDSGRLVVAGGADSFRDAFRIRLRPGTYEALVCYGGSREERYLVALYPGTEQTARELKGVDDGPPRPQRPPIAVSRLDASHVAGYRALMLRAYAEAPDAFTSTPEERAREPESWWLKRIADPTGQAVAFGCFDGATLVGTVAVEFSSKPKTRHKAHVIGMFVVPEARGRGAARALVDAALDHCRARGEIASIMLTVTEGNEPAIALYRSVGFRPFGVEPLAIRTAEGYRSKVHMQLTIDRGV